MKWIHSLLMLLSPARRRRFRLAARIYKDAVAQARQPAFYRDLGVPDTLEGRFDLLALHVALLCRRLGRLGPEGRALAQALFDTMFYDMELNLREIGINDPSLGRSIKSMARGFLGRAEAYGRGLDGAEALDSVLTRNLYAGDTPSDEALAQMASYVRTAFDRLETQDLETIMSGGVFPSAPRAARGEQQAIR